MRFFLLDINQAATYTKWFSCSTIYSRKIKQRLKMYQKAIDIQRVCMMTLFFHNIRIIINQNRDEQYGI